MLNKISNNKINLFNKNVNNNATETHANYHYSAKI